MFGSDVLFNLKSIVDWNIVTTKEQKEVDIDNVCENARKSRHDDAVGDLVYAEKIGIYHQSDYKKQGYKQIL